MRNRTVEIARHDQALAQCLAIAAEALAHP
jgi:hypothetical protein